MKTPTNANILNIFNGGGNIHYILPPFQREYTWGKTEWETLLDDLCTVYDEYTSDAAPEHFLGAMVIIEDGTVNGIIQTFKLVDGQQRLTSLSLLLCAFRDLMKTPQPKLYNQTQSMLINSMAAPNEASHYKIYPTEKYGDRSAYLHLLTEQKPDSGESNIPAAYDYFYKMLAEKFAANKMEAQKFQNVVLNCVQMVLISLDAKESPYKIFESLNAKGKPLSQADLIRNYIAMRLPSAAQDALFTQHWTVIEQLLQEKRSIGRLGEMTAFFRHYLAMRKDALCDERHVYARFRDRMEQDFKTPDAFGAEIGTLRTFAEYYDKLLRPEKETRPKVQEAMQRLNTLDVATAYPFLLAAYNAQAKGELSQTEFEDVLAIVENYLVRRFLAGEPTNYLSKLFPTLWRELQAVEEADPDGIGTIAALKQLLGDKKYPGDGTIRRALQTKTFYDSRSGTRDKTILVLDAINRHLHLGSGGYTKLDAAPTVEHILPQTLSDEWKQELGATWEQTHRDYLHTLGNLTLVTQEWNSSLSNSPFADKKAKLASHALRLNSQHFTSPIDVWNENAIQERAEFLADNILKIWCPLSVSTVADTKPPTASAVVEKWNADLFWTVLSTTKTPAEVAVAKRIHDWAEQNTDKIGWSENSVKGSFTPIVIHNAVKHQLFHVNPSRVEIYFYIYKLKPPYNDLNKRRELLRQLNKIPGVSLRDEFVEQGPTIQLDLLTSDVAMQMFLDVFKGFIEEVRSL